MSLRTTMKIRLAVLGLGLVVANAADAAATLKELAKPDVATARSGISQAAWRGGLDQWLEQNLFKSGAASFSFEYDGKSSSEFLSGWKYAATKRRLNPSQTQHVLTYTDPKSGLEVRCEAIVFQDYPAVEWVLKFKNTSGRETPILSNIQALDTRLADDGNEFTLHHALGVGEGIVARKEDFRPLSQALPPDSKRRFTATNGRSSWGDSLPFFNVEFSQNRGVIASIGWTGQWQADFNRDAKSLNLRAGMELTHLKLYSGEEIRSPKIMLLFWQGHRYYGQNLLRRMILAHYHPQKDGQPLAMPFAASAAALYHEAFKATEQNQLDYAKQFAPLGVEYLWMDVGWFEQSAPNSHLAPPDPKRFPNGLKPLSEELRKLNMGLLAWFAPEFQGGGSWMEKAFPEMFLRLKNQPAGIDLLNLGDRNALQFLLDHTSAMIAKEGIGIYRLDGPMGADCPRPQKQPLQWWRDADAPDRQGMTEIRYIEGLYTFWDELLKRHPGLIIDLCGGGATRIDIEAMSRCLYLWRSDWNHPGFEPDGEQSKNYGANLWLASAATGSGYPEPYSFRSSMNNGLVIAWNPYQPAITQDWPLAYPVKQKEGYELKKAPRTTVDKVVREGFMVTEPFPWEAARRLAAEYKRIRHLFYGDFYPLTPYSSAAEDWMAYQCHREDLRQGTVIAFRRSQCVREQARLKLWGLDARSRYEVRIEDTGKTLTTTGKKLAEGLDVTITDQPGSQLITYRQLL